MSLVPANLFTQLRSQINFWVEPTMAMVADDKWEYDLQLANAREFNAKQRLKLQLIDMIEVKFVEAVNNLTQQMVEANGKVVELTGQLEQLKEGYAAEKIAHEQEKAKMVELAGEIEKLKQILSD